MVDTGQIGKSVKAKRILKEELRREFEKRFDLREGLVLVGIGCNNKIRSSKEIQLMAFREYYNNHKTSTIGIATFLLFILLVVIVCFFPYWFTREGNPDLCFIGKGEIGDTIGGIMGPFVAIIAAFLTFIAFLIQYDANELQKKELERQKKIRQREEFEVKLYKMLDEHKDNLNHIVAGELRGRDAIPELLGELAYIYSCVHFVLNSLHKNKKFQHTQGDLGKVLQYLESLYEEPQTAIMNHLLLSYNLFFYGRPYHTVENMQAGKVLLENEVYSRLKSMKYVKSSNGFTIFINDENNALSMLPSQYEASFPMMKGHNDQLGVYFRQLYQTMMFIANADSTIFTEDDKYAYAKLLRSNMSDTEQVLLYYNSLSEMGEKWNKRTGDVINRREDMGLIARFRLIKNIPANFLFFGKSPMKNYSEEKKYWKDKEGKNFFEHSTFLLNGNSVIAGRTA